MNIERMSPPQLRKLCRDRGISQTLDGEPFSNKTTKPEFLAALGVTKKKGNSSWKPAKKLDVRMSDEVKGKFRIRWRDNDKQNIQKALAEGWEFIDPVKGVRAEHDNPGDSNPLGSTTEYRELVLMGLPEDVARERDQYFEEQTNKSVEGVHGQLKSDIERVGTETYGEIRIK